MTESNKVFITALCISGIVVFLTTVGSVLFLYHTAVEEQKGRLLEIVTTQAKFIDVVHENVSVHGNDMSAQTHMASSDELKSIFARLSKVWADLAAQSEGKSPALNFYIAEARGQQIYYHIGTKKLTDEPTPYSTIAGKPMDRALNGETGVLKTKDHMGHPILCAFTRVESTGLGIVAKIFLSDLQRPFVKTALITYAVAFFLFLVSGVVMRRTVSPLVARLEKALRDLKNALAEVKTLSGLLPICAACKKIRDDKGYWNQIEGYIQEHSDAEFSHGVCPECTTKLYPDLNLTLK